MIYITIAGRTFGIKTKKQEAVQERMKANYGPFMIPDVQPESELLFTVDIDSRINPPKEPPLKIFGYDLTGDKAEMFIYPGRYILSVHNRASGRTFTMDCPLDNPTGQTQGGCTFCADLTIQGIAPPHHILDHLLIFAFSVAAAGNDILLIHASTVVYENRAVMFLGESGTGKSTHSRMWLENIAGASLLNDDAPALGIGKDGAVSAYGTPWSGKTPCYLNRSYPLAAMVRIKRAPYNFITVQNPLESFGAILPSNLPTLQQDDVMLDQVCGVLSKVIESLPVFILECLPDAEAAEVSRNAVFG